MPSYAGTDTGSPAPTGGRLLEDATGTDPYEAVITLLLPSSVGDEVTSGVCSNLATKRYMYALVFIATIVALTLSEL